METTDRAETSAKKQASASPKQPASAKALSLTREEIAVGVLTALIADSNVGAKLMGGMPPSELKSLGERFVKQAFLFADDFIAEASK